MAILLTRVDDTLTPNLGFTGKKPHLKFLTRAPATVDTRITTTGDTRITTTGDTRVTAI